MRNQRTPRFSLVLGSGGTAGGAFHAGVLKALHDVWGLDPRSADLIIGTSAGALSGSLLAAGLTADDLFRRETGKTLSPTGERRLQRARSRIPRDREKATAHLGRPAAPELLTRAMIRPMTLAPGAVASGFLPRGHASTKPIEGLVGDLLDNTWPTRPELKVVAVELHQGRRVVFHRGSGVPVAKAVAASCSVPGVFSPVRIDRSDYVDGAVHSSDNVDVLRREPPQQLVIVSSPMGSQRVTDRPGFWSAYRAVTKAQTSIEIGMLSGDPRVVMVLPGPDDLDAMGPDMLDTNRRATVAMQAYSTASDRFRSLDPPTPRSATPAKEKT